MTLPAPPEPEPRRRTSRGFSEANIPIRPDAKGKATPAFRVRPGDQIIRTLTIASKHEWQTADGTNMVTLTTDDGVSKVFAPTDDITTWAPDTYPPLP